MPPERTEPVLSTLWWFPRWTNPDFTGAWEVVQLGGGHPGYEATADGKVRKTEGFGEFAIYLQRCGGRRQIHETDGRYWPNGWQEFPDGD